jgi:hypothetical protein
MIVRDIKQELFEILGFVDSLRVFREVTGAMRKLQLQGDDGHVEVILIQSWEDEINVKDKKALLFMVRSQELYRTNFFDEAQKYEGLAVKYFLEEGEEKERQG